LLILALAVLAACGRPADQPDPAPGVEPSLSREELAGAEYPVDESPGATVRLVDGVYPPGGVAPSPDEFTVRLAEPLAIGRFGDGGAAAAVVVETSGGGTGSFVWLYLMGRVQNQARVLAGAFLGDRVEVAALQLVGDTIQVRLVTQGPDDPMCCPTLEVVRRYVRADGALREVTSERE